MSYRESTDEELQNMLNSEEDKKVWKVSYKCGEGKSGALRVKAIQLHEKVLGEYLKDEHGANCVITNIERVYES